ncbi:hypothetical protein L9H26_19235 [Morganella psychrotolerans]|uniref:Uncharacterized protein n=1 Tax=Morganella psychrotolerans TaxID=368603 RepID=A0A5M9QWF2_9GAMM|nr:hypothetical protein [Morganella psychrotolerans]KAA8713034.1 hypothetical protein F4V73_18135 [Morganella psychrotolerans]OBU01869.1 hypothetical protein AYY16_16770 [Morganella psychrotolerans]
MALSGIQILKPDGKPIFQASDRVARIAGKHVIKYSDVTDGVYEKSFNHDELRPFGDMFIFMNTDYFLELIGAAHISLDGYTINLKFWVDRRDWLESDREDYLEIYYGVR